jgi:hypothetical protein
MERTISAAAWAEGWPLEPRSTSDPRAQAQETIKASDTAFRIDQQLRLPRGGFVSWTSLPILYRKATGLCDDRRRIEPRLQGILNRPMIGMRRKNWAVRWSTGAWFHMQHLQMVKPRGCAARSIARPGRLLYKGIRCKTSCFSTITMNR